MELKNKIKIVLNKINRHGRENIAAAVILKIFIGIGFFVVLWLLRSYSADFCLRTLEQKAEEAQRDIYIQFSAIQDNLEMLANIIETEEDLTSEHVANILRLNADKNVVSNLGIILEDGSIMEQDGTLFTPEEISRLDSQDEGEFSGSINLEDDESDTLFILFNVPIEKDGKEVGTLYGVIEPQDLSKYFEVNIFDGNANVFIIDSHNMDNVMDTVHDRVENVHELKNFPLKKGYSEEQITKDFEEGVGGRTAYFSETSNEYLYSAYEPVGFYDWFIMVTVPESTVFKETEYIGKVLLGLGIYEAVILLIYFLWDVIHTRKEVRAKERMATTDLLTNLKNRNAFEQTLARYEEQLPAVLSCVYADANGLHELNNSQGHAAGDKMLQTVAASFLELFGQEQVYRIGGDEFLVFAGMDLAGAFEKALAAKKKVGEAGYHVSIGASSAEENPDIAAVIKSAEQKMYEDKKRYYMELGDRRKMR